jgi:RNA polymerase sigma-70 factor (ECF subfamily)
MSRPNARLIAEFAESAVARYGRQLHRFLLRRVRHTQDAEDLAQEVFMRLTRIENSDFVQKPRAYLFGVAWHVICEFRMRRARLHEWLTFDSEVADQHSEGLSGAADEDLADRLDSQEQLRAALARLPPIQLAVLLLHKRDGYSYEEIGAQLDLPVRKIESHLAEAKARLRAMRWDR